MIHQFFQVTSILIFSSPSWAVELLAGPMVSHTTDNSAVIWVETDRSAEVKVDYWASPGKKVPLVGGTAKGRTSRTPPHTGVVEITGLRPRTQVRYGVFLDAEPVRSLTPQVFYTMPQVHPDSNDVPGFTVAFGSCVSPARQPVQPIWAEVAQHRPEAFLYIGDIGYMPGNADGYGDNRSLVRKAIAGYHREIRYLSGLRTLMATTPSYGIWDDHDYGPNNSDRTFRWREDSLDIYKRYWPNAGAGTTAVPGVFYSFQIADAEFFMLDNRYHRDPNEAEDRKTMFGEGQLSWLKSRLKASSATFKVIASGGSVVVNEGRGERWAKFATERDDFLKWLFAKNITGVFFICGDWHIGTLNRLYRPEDTYPLYELLSSNAGIRTEPFSRMITDRSGGHNQSAAPQFRGYNFGVLRFSGERGERVVKLQIIDEHGEVQVHRRLKEEDLRRSTE